MNKPWPINQIGVWWILEETGFSSVATFRLREHKQDLSLVFLNFIRLPLYILTTFSAQIHLMQEYVMEEKTA